MKEKIVIINNGLAGGGIERASISMSNYFASLGYEVTLLALYKTEHFYQLDNRIVFIEPSFTRKKLNKTSYIFKIMAYVRKHIKAIYPNVVLAYGEWTNPFVIMSLTKLNIPVYITERMSPILKLSSYHAILQKIFYKKANGIIAQTKYAKKVIENKTGAKNISVIPNPVNVIEKTECEPKKIIVTVGRLSKEKGHKYLIEAFAHINDKTWELSIVGDGSERPFLEQLAEQLGVKERIIFHGKKKDFSLQLSEAQIFVLPSLSEGFPNALIEAMSFPMACISSNCIAGPSDIIENGINGILVEPADSVELSKVLNMLIEDEELRKKITQNAYKIRQEYNFKKIANQYLNVLLEQ